MCIKNFVTVKNTKKRHILQIKTPSNKGSPCWKPIQGSKLTWICNQPMWDLPQMISNKLLLESSALTQQAKLLRTLRMRQRSKSSKMCSQICKTPQANSTVCKCLKLKDLWVECPQSLHVTKDWFSTLRSINRSAIELISTNDPTCSRDGHPSRNLCHVPNTKLVKEFVSLIQKLSFITKTTMMWQKMITEMINNFQKLNVWPKMGLHPLNILTTLVCQTGLKTTKNVNRFKISMVWWHAQLSGIQETISCQKKMLLELICKTKKICQDSLFLKTISKSWELWPTLSWKVWSKNASIETETQRTV